MRLECRTRPSEGDTEPAPPWRCQSIRNLRPGGRGCVRPTRSLVRPVRLRSPPSLSSGRTRKIPSLPESISVALGRTFSPGVIVVAELDAFAKRRMIGAPELEQQSRPRIAEGVLLQLHER